MWERDHKDQESDEYRPVLSDALKDAMRQARIESAERSGVVVDLRDAELARLELLNEALDPLFAEIPDEIELFDRGISHGDIPRLWVDVVAHVVMGRDKRQYRFVQDGRYGRKILAESTDIEDIVRAITHYVASRLVERERALTEKLAPLPGKTQFDLRMVRTLQLWRMMRMFIFGLIVGCVALFTALWIAAWHAQP
jgi:hypothetical protein